MGRHRVARLLLALACAWVAAGGGEGSARPPATTGAGVRRFTNPVLSGNFADPFVLKVGDSWYAYATGDPHRFVDRDGAAYLLWKNDGNCCGQPTELWGQRLDRDGLALEGRPQRLGVRNDVAWEGDLIEAPTLWREGDRSYLLSHSANDYGSTDYAVGYATASRVLGPYRDGPGDPILRSRGGAAGPGGQAVVRAADGDLWLAYHAWDSSAVGDEAGGQRSMWLDRLRFENGRPRIEGPTDGPQEAP